MSMGFTREHGGLVRALHRIIDVLSIPLAAWLAYVFFASTNGYANEALILMVGVVTLSAVALYPSLDLYRAWRGETRLRELAVALSAFSLTYMLAGLFFYVIGLFDVSGSTFFVAWYILGAALTLIERVVTRSVLNLARARGYNIRTILVVGDGAVAEDAIKSVKKAMWTGYRAVGYLGDSDAFVSSFDVPRLGGFADLEQVILRGDLKFDQIWIALPLEQEKTINQILSQLRFATQDVRVVPGLSSFRLINHSVASVANIPVINVSVSPMDGVNRLVKGIEDKILALMILLLISPVMFILALGVKLTSPGPVFYRQERVSWNGRPFSMLKFRSMPIDTESKGVQWGNSKGKATSKFGQFIRKTSLDELPQFINVLKGDMSIVGPRPERTIFVEKFKHEIPGYMQKHMVKAGITGWAQINGWRGDTDLNKRVEYDLYYIDNWSLWFDIRIIFLTIFKGFINKNAY